MPKRLPREELRRVRREDRLAELRPLAEALVAELERRGRSKWHLRGGADGLQKALGWTDSQWMGASKLLLREHRMESSMQVGSAGPTRYRLNNARLVEGV